MKTYHRRLQRRNQQCARLQRHNQQRVRRWLWTGIVAIAIQFATAISPVAISPIAPAFAQYPYSDRELNQTVSPAETTPSDAGGLFAQVDGATVSFPLDSTAVQANIVGNVSRVEVRQQFTNPYDRPLEAIYQFPLPEDAAVDDMEIRIGNLVVRGNIRERQEAREVYEQAVEAGQTAALLEQERPNLFTQSLANIVPGETIQVVIRYTDSLTFEGGDYEFDFPTVVAPRYIPEGSVSRVPDASRVSPRNLSPGEPTGQSLSITVDIDAGVPIQEVNSPSHAIETTEMSDSSVVQVTLADEDIPLNKDFILRYRVTGDNTQATVLTQSDDRGGHFATYFIPAARYRDREIAPKDVVFLIDTSGSQAGPPIEQSKELMRHFIEELNPDDTFSILDFSNATHQLSAAPLSNTRQHRQQALQYINRLQAEGGTELRNGIDTVLQFPASEGGRLRSIVLLTDGLIGNDEEIIGVIRDRLKPGNRIYTFGVGSSTNRFLLERLAELGRGTAEILPPNEPADTVVQTFVQTINKPVLTSVELNWVGDGDAPKIYPIRLPDLFANQPLVAFGRKQDAQNGQLEITGRLANGDRYREVLPVEFDSDDVAEADANPGNEGIAQLWGRARIKDLMNQMYRRETELGIQAVTDTALDYRLLSKYTAFVAVTEDVRVNPNEESLRQDVPLESPEGMQLPGVDPRVQNFTRRGPVSNLTGLGNNLSSPAPPAYSVPEPHTVLANLLMLVVLLAWLLHHSQRQPQST
ncbi:MAG: VIT domain-containing protein [Cyanobacteria bacterium P01_A01_bin.3]